MPMGIKDEPGFHLQLAIASSTKAANVERKGNLNEAMNLFERAVRYYQHGLKYEAEGEIARETIKAKCKQCSEQAAKLRSILQKLNE